MNAATVEEPQQTLNAFLEAALGTTPEGRDLADVLLHVGDAVRAVSREVARGALARSRPVAGAVNVQGETQKPLDVLANDLFLRICADGECVAGMASEEMEDPVAVPCSGTRTKHLLVFDPLDGSSNIDINVTVGSIFSVLRHAGAGEPQPEHYLQPGHRQLAAGYALYGPSTLLVLSVGDGTHGFSLDADRGTFVLTHPALRIAPEAREFAINMSNARFWEPPVQRYVAACKAGVEGDIGRDYNMRWVASMVAEVHRILLRGGVYLYPRDRKLPRKAGRLRLLYEANPMAMLVEQAGGRASTGRARLSDVVPDAIHQRIPVILGAREDVERIERYHREFDEGSDKPFASPLFNEFSLFLPEAR